MDLMSIGEFARRSGLSPKALRLYDKLGLLPPARVDADSGYRFYQAAHLERARLVAALRQLQTPLAEIEAILDLEPSAAAARIEEYWPQPKSSTLLAAHWPATSSIFSTERGP